ncbi:hypothetical protein D9758_016538 [Tetrapyrgos nigripes]|uniref:Uncharacterized protein n=1 Tax=Tetrapyrgos nigripes TaxID=182062 RepID=A0A8H5CB89_9AGAR|nr:hypothetical protein D9758_016538 [Tetrapyrgos nigripes]
MTVLGSSQKCVSNAQVEAAQKKEQETLASAQQTAGRVLEGAKKVAGPLGEGWVHALLLPPTYHVQPLRLLGDLQIHLPKTSPLPCSDLGWFNVPTSVRGSPSPH